MELGLRKGFEGYYFAVKQYQGAERFDVPAMLGVKDTTSRHVSMAWLLPRREMSRTSI